MKELENGAKTFTVGELIEKLKIWPKDTPVMLTDDFMDEAGIRGVSNPKVREDRGYWGDETAVLIYRGDEPY